MIAYACTTSQSHADLELYIFNILIVIHTTYNTIITQFTIKIVTYVHMIIAIVVIYY